MNAVTEVVEILDLLYKHGWDERNGGNLSLIVDKENIKNEIKEEKVIRKYTYDFDMSSIVGKYFVITGTGKYFKNAVKDPETTIGIFKVEDKHTLSLLWGLKDGGGPTSETPTHLQCHIERLKKDSDHHVVMHCHPDNVIAMTHVHDLNEAHWTRDLWVMQTESIVVFPEGVGVLPWMVCGGREIGDATALKMQDYRSVVWAQHGLFCTGRTLDEAYGLVETIEKAASIYMKVFDKKIYQSITDDELKKLAKAFNITYKKGVID